MQEVINFVQSVGFPIVIALLFYIDLRKVVKCNTGAINALAKQQARFVQVLRRPYLTYSGRVNMHTNRAPANRGANKGDTLRHTQGLRISKVRSSLRDSKKGGD